MVSNSKDSNITTSIYCENGALVLYGVINILSCLIVFDQKIDNGDGICGGISKAFTLLPGREENW